MTIPRNYYELPSEESETPVALKEKYWEYPFDDEDDDDDDEFYDKKSVAIPFKRLVGIFLWSAAFVTSSLIIFTTE